MTMQEAKQEEARIVAELKAALNRTWKGRILLFKLRVISIGTDFLRFLESVQWYLILAWEEAKVFTLTVYLWMLTGEWMNFEEEGEA